MPAIEGLIERLLLDSENPRIGSANSQRDALQKILDDQGEKLYALAEDIVDEGISPIDRLLVLREKKESDRFIVLEGNRRVAALKILANHHVLTDLQLRGPLQKRFEELAGRFKREDVEPIACFEVSTREEGSRWILLRHTGENEGRGVVSWSGLATSRFRGGDPALQALDFVKTHGNLGESEKESISKTFPITTLERLLATREIRDLIGIDVFEKKLRSGLQPDELLKPLKRMVLDLAYKKVNVSKLKSKADQIEYVKGFGSKDTPDLSKIGIVRSIDSIRGEEFEKKDQRQTKRRTSDPSERKTIAPGKVRLNIPNGRTATIFKELKGIKVTDYPNAGAVLFRVFLEHSVDFYMVTNNLPRKFKDTNGRTLDKKLNKKVEEVVNHLVEEKDCERKDFRGVVRGLSVSHSPFNIDLLHDYVHNRFVTPSPRELIAAWDDAQPFFEKLWP